VYVLAACCFICRASDQSPLTIVSSSSPEPTLESQGGHDDITSYKTWVKFLPDAEAQAKERFSPEIPVVCPTPVKGDISVVVNMSTCCCLHQNIVKTLGCNYVLSLQSIIG